MERGAGGIHLIQSSRHGLTSVSFGARGKIRRLAAGSVCFGFVESAHQALIGEAKIAVGTDHEMIQAADTDQLSCLTEPLCNLGIFLAGCRLHFRLYANLMNSVMTGRPAAEATLGMPAFEYFGQNPEYSRVFNDAMTALSTPVAGAAIEAYDFSQYGLIVDVAGGHGEVLISILGACPDVRGILAEVAHVVEGARPRISSAGLSDRCQAVECDFLKAVPEGGDAYVMKHIIHDWDDEKASMILRNIRTAMDGKRGVVILLESVIPIGPEPDLGKSIDIEMLVWLGGRERTAEEFRALFDRSGFELTKIVPTKSPLSVIEAIPK